MDDEDDFFSYPNILFFLFGTYASSVKPKNRLHRPKSFPSHPKNQYTGTQQKTFLVVKSYFLLGCLTLDGCNILTHMLSEKSLKDKSSISMLEQKTSQISETETEKTIHKYQYAETEKN